ncbi:MAG: hypothetical protein K2X27_06960, partial [Candidatus Obscuribacterales bacterium]|nr:hypothetical protein [Candidatus Obscuribacterales bacterium]
YFERKGDQNWWSFDEVEAQKNKLLSLLSPAFKPSAVNRRLEIAELKAWRDGFLEAHKRDVGPHPTCARCTSKCVFRFEVSELVRDPKIRFDFNSSINDSAASASENAARFCRLLCERLIGAHDIDLSYCLAVHLIKDQQLSSDAQLVLLNKIRMKLEEYSLEINA